MKLLGLRFCDHDANMTLLEDGIAKYHKIERRTGIKHHALNNLWEWQIELKEAFNLNPEDIDEIALTLDSWKYENYNIDVSPNFPAQHFDLLVGAKCPVWWMDHHLAHSESYSPFLDAESDISIIIDGFGDRDITWTVFKNNEVLDRGSVEREGSIGLLYNNFGVDLDFPNAGNLDDAGKVMGIQAYGDVDKVFYKKFVGNTPAEMCNFQNWMAHNHNDYFVAANRQLDWVRTCHELLGSYVLRLFDRYASSDDQISYSGGVALNVCWNTKLREKYNNLKIFPHCMDDGLSIGSVEWLRKKNNLQPFKISNFPYCQNDNSPETTPSDNTINEVVDLLVDGKIVGWYQGHGEIGYRALGNRSILMRPDLKDGKDYINNKVKHRENFRPFGATILKEHSQKYFKNKFDNPYMLYSDTFLDDDTEFKSIKHVDNTCRTQTLSNENPIYRKLLEMFYEKTGIPMLLNTSLNGGGMPICGSVEDAIRMFYVTELDVLVIGNKIYKK